MSTRYISHGKLLLTGEYLALHGARALAIPARYNHWMDVQESAGELVPVIRWTAKSRGSEWFDAVYRMKNLVILETNDRDKAQLLAKILIEVFKLSKDIVSGSASWTINTDTDFPVGWGLGTSATLIANLAAWANIPPFELYFRVSNGSGYDLACSLSEVPLIYRLRPVKPEIEKIRYFPVFHESIYFVNLGLKQHSSVSVERFNKKGIVNSKMIDRMNELTEKFVNSPSLEDLNETITEHERLISSAIGMKPVKENFGDFTGTMKSLGAWGGDFVLVTWPYGIESLRAYFAGKGLYTVIPFKEMAL